NLGWESTHQTDYGVDLGLWSGRVSLTGDIYKKKTSNLLLAVNLPFESGFASALQNTGAVSNNGVELGLTLTVLDSRNSPIGWTPTSTSSHNTKRCPPPGGFRKFSAKRGTTAPRWPGGLIRAGSPPGVFSGFKPAGLLRAWAPAAAYPTAVKPLSGT